MQQSLFLYISFPVPAYWYEIKRLYGKDYFVPQYDRNASEARAKCKEMRGHPAAILTMDDSKAVREIAAMCEWFLSVQHMTRYTIKELNMTS